MEPKKVYLTQKGLDELKKEYDELANNRRPEVVSRLSAARDMGDLSENAEYHAAREELAFIDGRIDELEMIIKHAAIIEGNGHHAGTVVSLGSVVTLKLDGKNEVFTIVGEWEADPAEKKISHESPLGKAMMGKAVGEEVEFQAPAGKRVYKIVSIK